MSDIKKAHVKEYMCGWVNKIEKDDTLGEALNRMVKEKTTSLDVVDKKIRHKGTISSHLIKKVIEKYPNEVRFIRDATRGGVASVLNEIVSDKDFSAKLIEKNLPIKAETASICDILGIDPLYSANEGKLIMVVNSKYSDEIISLMKQTKEGKEATIIGEITDEFKSRVYVETLIKGRRMVPLLLEDQLPRIC